MTERKKSKVGAAGLTRSEVVTVRLDPKLRYIADLAARKQRRSVSSFIEWAVERGVDSVYVAEQGPSLWNEADELWDVDESDRFVKLALRHPDLLSHDEQIVWKLVRENGYLWRGSHDRNNEWHWTPSESAIILDRLREHWNTFKAAAKGDVEARSELPTWDPPKKPARPAGKFDDLEDEIPF